MSFRIPTALLVLPLLVSSRGSQPAPQSAEEMRLLGVCSYSESAVECWRSDGSPAPHLRPQVDTAVRKDARNLRWVRLGEKNRVLVFARPRGSRVTYGNLEGPIKSGITNPGLVFIHPIGSNVTYPAPGETSDESFFEPPPLIDAFGPETDIVFASSPQERMVGSITARAQRIDPPPVMGEVPLEVGARLTVDDVGLRIVSIERVVAKDPSVSLGARATREGPRWKVALAIDARTNPNAAFGFELRGRDGMAIQRVDAKGRPMPPTLDPRVGPNGLLNGHREMGASRGGTDLLLSVDPAFVGRLRFGVARIQVGVFKDVPLEPRR